MAQTANLAFDFYWRLIVIEYLAFTTLFALPVILSEGRVVFDHDRPTMSARWFRLKQLLKNFFNAHLCPFPFRPARMLSIITLISQRLPVLKTYQPVKFTELVLHVQRIPFLRFPMFQNTLPFSLFPCVISDC